jgi:tetratricopeptide (TPR) repeat protein
MFNIIPLILILISLLIIVVIVVRKFPVLANLDVNSIQSEREARFKEQIISNRLKRNFYRYYNQILKIARPILGLSGNFFRWSYEKLLEFRDNYNQEKQIVEDSEISVERLFLEFDEAMQEDKEEEAEQKLIEIIGLDPKNVKAFRLLGEVYMNKKNFGEAKQTWEHALRLAEKEQDKFESNVEKELSDEEMTEKEAINCVVAELCFNLALVNLKNESYDEALKQINRALETQSNNPRYLDTKLEISIIKKDKHLAEKTYNKFEKVNPENKKLEEFKEQIDAL